MILVFEHDSRDHGSGRFNWRPARFRGRWNGARTWRISWGFWSLSYYPSPGLRDFFDRVESGETEWKGRRSASDAGMRITRDAPA